MLYQLETFTTLNSACSTKEHDAWKIYIFLFNNFCKFLFCSLPYNKKALGKIKILT